MGNKSAPAVHLRQAKCCELERGNDTDVGTTATDRPEQVGLGVGVDAVEDAIAGDQLDRRESGHRKAVPARQPAVSAAERVPGHPHASGGPGPSDHAVRSEGLA